MITKGAAQKSYLILIVLIFFAGAAAYLFISTRGTNIADNTQPKQNQQSVTNNQQSIDTSDWLIFKSEKFGYEVKYPKGVKVKHDKNTNEGEQETFDLYLEKYFSIPTELIEEKNKAVGGLFPLGVGIEANKEINSQHLSIRDWVYQNVHEQKQAPEPQFERDMTFNGEPAYYFEYTYIGDPGSGGLYKHVRYSIYFFHNNSIYQISGIKPPSNPSEKWKNHPYYSYLEKYVPISEAIIKSFKFTDTK